MRRWSHKLGNGEISEWAGCVVTEEGRELRVIACAILYGPWLYELVAWGLERDTVEAVAESMVLGDLGP